MSESGENAIKKVIEGGYCIGCGACAVVDDQILINFDKYGLLRPKGVTRRIFEANAVCPFSAKINEDAIAINLYDGQDTFYDKRVGYYRSIYIGHVANGFIRDRGSSSGFVTWLLAELLNRKLIDGVIHAKPAFGSGALFEYGLSHTVEEVLNVSKSKYYPVHFDQVLKQMRGNGRKYAFVGVPCYVKSIRLICKLDRELSSQIVCCIALFCGHMKSASYSYFIARQLGISSSQLRYIDFRVKDQNASANRYKVSATLENGNRNKTITSFAYKLYGMDWGLGYFKPKACDWCDDVVGETADISSGDAWLPGYVNDPSGNNVVIVRSALLKRIVDQAVARGSLIFDLQSVEEVYNSQAGNYRHRHEGLSFRICNAKKEGVWHPEKRINAYDYSVSLKRARIYRHRERLSDKSHKRFFSSKEDPLLFGLKMFIDELFYYLLNKRLFKGFIKMSFQLASLSVKKIYYGGGDE